MRIPTGQINFPTRNVPYSSRCDENRSTCLRARGGPWWLCEKKEFQRITFTLPGSCIVVYSDVPAGSPAKGPCGRQINCLPRATSLTVAVAMKIARPVRGSAVAHGGTARKKEFQRITFILPGSLLSYIQMSPQGLLQRDPAVGRHSSSKMQRRLYNPGIIFPVPGKSRLWCRS
ncbi:hypothetical protein B0I18_10746 [Taibaiella chishuiensis]|uniref:Uncharacterized protein n=1 Tax=Taibaiella chishuiensis TaxID=1434707 RepID=A0A2P8D0E7_9BACT|nr:hypothetical protein B0I18_10746 [Taibaiella chishuiensis]